MTVRDKAVESLSTVIEELPQQHVAEHVLPLLRRIGGRDWFTSRVAAAALIPPTYSRVGDEGKTELRTLYKSVR